MEILCFDASGSTKRCEDYWNAVTNLVSWSKFDALLSWSRTCKRVNHVLENREFGGTQPDAFMDFILQNFNTYYISNTFGIDAQLSMQITTDGRIDEYSIRQCSTILHRPNFPRLRKVIIHYIGDKSRMNFGLNAIFGSISDLSFTVNDINAFKPVPSVEDLENNDDMFSPEFLSNLCSRISNLKIEHFETYKRLRKNLPEKVKKKHNELKINPIPTEEYFDKKDADGFENAIRERLFISDEAEYKKWMDIFLGCFEGISNITIADADIRGPDNLRPNVAEDYELSVDTVVEDNITFENIDKDKICVLVKFDEPALFECDSKFIKNPLSILNDEAICTKIIKRFELHPISIYTVKHLTSGNFMTYPFTRDRCRAFILDPSNMNEINFNSQALVSFFVSEQRNKIYGDKLLWQLTMLYLIKTHVDSTMKKGENVAWPVDELQPLVNAVLEKYVLNEELVYNLTLHMKNPLPMARVPLYISLWYIIRVAPFFATNSSRNILRQPEGSTLLNLVKDLNLNDKVSLDSENQHRLHFRVNLWRLWNQILNQPLAKTTFASDIIKKFKQYGNNGSEQGLICRHSISSKTTEILCFEASDSTEDCKDYWNTVENLAKSNKFDALLSWSSVCKRVDNVLESRAFARTEPNTLMEFILHECNTDYISKTFGQTAELSLQITTDGYVSDADIQHCCGYLRKPNFPRFKKVIIHYIGQENRMNFGLNAIFGSVADLSFTINDVNSLKKVPLIEELENFDDIHSLEFLSYLCSRITYLKSENLEAFERLRKNLIDKLEKKRNELNVLISPKEYFDKNDAVGLEKAIKERCFASNQTKYQNWIKKILACFDEISNITLANIRDRDDLQPNIAEDYELSVDTIVEDHITFENIDEDKICVLLKFDEPALFECDSKFIKNPLSILNDEAICTKIIKRFQLQPISIVTVKHLTSGNFITSPFTRDRCRAFILDPSNMKEINFNSQALVSFFVSEQRNKIYGDKLLWQLTMLYLIKTHVDSMVKKGENVAWPVDELQPLVNAVLEKYVLNEELVYNLTLHMKLPLPMARVPLYISLWYIIRVAPFFATNSSCNILRQPEGSTLLNLVEDLNLNDKVSLDSENQHRLHFRVNLWRLWNQILNQPLAKTTFASDIIEKFKQYGNNGSEQGLICRHSISSKTTEILCFEASDSTEDCKDYWNTVENLAKSNKFDALLSWSSVCKRVDNVLESRAFARTEPNTLMEFILRECNTDYISKTFGQTAELSLQITTDGYVSDADIQHCCGYLRKPNFPRFKKVIIHYIGQENRMNFGLNAIFGSVADLSFTINDVNSLKKVPLIEELENFDDIHTPEFLSYLCSRITYLKSENLEAFERLRKNLIDKLEKKRNELNALISPKEYFDKNDAVGLEKAIKERCFASNQTKYQNWIKKILACFDEISNITLADIRNRDDLQTNIAEDYELSVDTVVEDNITFENIDEGKICILVKLDQPAIFKVDSEYVKNPLLIFQDKATRKKITKRFEYYPLTIKMVKMISNGSIITSPHTRHQCKVFILGPSNRNEINFNSAALASFFVSEQGNKIYGDKLLWHLVILYLIKTHIDSAVKKDETAWPHKELQPKIDTVLRQYILSEKLLHRITLHIKIPLPVQRVPLYIAFWYIFRVAPFFAANSTRNVLRYPGTSILVNLFEDLKLHDTIFLGTETMKKLRLKLKLWRLWNEMLIRKDDIDLKLTTRAGYQNYTIVLDKIVLLSGPRPTELPAPDLVSGISPSIVVKMWDTLTPKSTHFDPINEDVDSLKTPVPIVLPGDSIEYESVYHMQIDPETLRPTKMCHFRSKWYARIFSLYCAKYKRYPKNSDQLVLLLNRTRAKDYVSSKYIVNYMKHVFEIYQPVAKTMSAAQFVEKYDKYDNKAHEAKPDKIVKIEEISISTRFACVAGVIVDIENETEYDTGKSRQKISIVDKSGIIRIIIWNEHFKATLGDGIIIKRGEVCVFEEELQIHVDDVKDTVINDQSSAITELKSWYEEEGKFVWPTFKFPTINKSAKRDEKASTSTITKNNYLSDPSGPELSSSYSQLQFLEDAINEISKVESRIAELQQELDFYKRKKIRLEKEIQEYSSTS